MPIHKEGYTSIALCILLIFVSNALIQFYLPQDHVFMWIVYSLSFILFVGVIWFFRSSNTDVVTDEQAAFSPVDGKVTAIEEVDEPEFIKGRSLKITIKPTLANTHVNRNPITGTVKYISAETHNTIAVENTSGAVVVYKQIPGFAKHVIAHVKPNDTVQQGAKFGFGMLGSSVDVFLPIGTKTNVDINDVVKGGQTVLARFQA